MQAGHARCWSEEGPPLLIQIDKSNLPLGLRLRLLRLLTARLVLKPRRVVSYHHVLLLHVEPRDPQARERDIRYVGRSAASSPATASHAIHVSEQQEIVNAALGGRESDVPPMGGM